MDKDLMIVIGGIALALIVFLAALFFRGGIL
jgi:hypothetical protein